VPAAVLVAVGVSAVWGESGVLERHLLMDRLAEANAELAAVERENQRLYRELVLLEQDPRVVERLVADELGWARTGTTVYRFDAEDGRPAGRAATAGPPHR
jgi:cell division protein FtsB